MADTPEAPLALNEKLAQWGPAARKARHPRAMLRTTCSLDTGLVKFRYVTACCCDQVCRPEVTDTPEAPRAANAKLAQMGPMSRDERIMLGTMLGAVVLWVLGDKLGVPAVTAAMLGLCALLLSGVLKWRDCLDYSAVRLPLAQPHQFLFWPVRFCF